MRDTRVKTVPLPAYCPLNVELGVSAGLSFYGLQQERRNLARLLLRVSMRLQHSLRRNAYSPALIGALVVGALLTGTGAAYGQNSASTGANLIGRPWCGQGFLNLNQCASNPASACQAIVAATGTAGSGLPPEQWTYAGIGPLFFSGPYAGVMCLGSTSTLPPNTYFGPIYLNLDQPGCMAGYTQQPDGSCQPRPMVQACSIANPTIPGTGTKILAEAEDGVPELSVSRAYRSYSVYGAGNGFAQWTLNWQRSLDTGMSTFASPEISALRGDGSVLTYRPTSGGAWVASGTQDTLSAATDSTGKVTGWQYVVADTGMVETYTPSGKLLSVRERNGRTTVLTYNAAGQLATVTAPSGRSLSFAYDSSGRIGSVTAPDGALTSYGYNSAGMLSNVTRPDGSVRQYVYEDSRFPTALTGIVDENNSRYAVYAYDDQARTVSSAHAGGTDSYQFQYGANYQTTVTDPTGKTSVYSFLQQNGVLLPTSISAPCGLCGSTRQSSSYDANNNLIQETDYLGNVTTHAYDNQKREIQKVEGSGTPGARTTSTRWHAQFWNLRTQVASPTKLETYSYDSNGNLISYSETPTSDSNGSQGFSATATGPTRTTTWTYTTDGQVASRSGPRTDVNDSTTYVYRTADDTNTPPQYRKGDLYQIVDALGHITTVNQYDPNGRPLQVTDANGGVTAFTYSNRGWLIGQVVTPVNGAAQTTNYSYDVVGQLTKVTLPDGSTMSFTYDAAHRMTGATDSQGNSITYTLDAMGNRTEDKVKDPSGNLARQITRVFDSMSRPLKVTVGATQ